MQRVTSLSRPVSGLQPEVCPYHKSLPVHSSFNSSTIPLGTRSPIPSFTHSLTHSFIHSFIHPLTHSHSSRVSRPTAAVKPYLLGGYVRLLKKNWSGKGRFRLRYCVLTSRSLYFFRRTETDELFGQQDVRVSLSDVAAVEATGGSEARRKDKKPEKGPRKRSHSEPRASPAAGELSQASLLGTQPLPSREAVLGSLAGSWGCVGVRLHLRKPGKKPQGGSGSASSTPKQNSKPQEGNGVVQLSLPTSGGFCEFECVNASEAATWRQAIWEVLLRQDERNRLEAAEAERRRLQDQHGEEFSLSHSALSATLSSEVASGHRHSSASLPSDSELSPQAAEQKKQRKKSRQEKQSKQKKQKKQKKKDGKRERRQFWKRLREQSGELVVPEAPYSSARAKHPLYTYRSGGALSESSAGSESSEESSEDGISIRTPRPQRGLHPSGSLSSLQHGSRSPRNAYSLEPSTSLSISELHTGSRSRPPGLHKSRSFHLPSSSAAGTSGMDHQLTSYLSSLSFPELLLVSLVQPNHDPSLRGGDVRPSPDTARGKGSSDGVGFTDRVLYRNLPWGVPFALELPQTPPCMDRNTSSPAGEEPSSASGRRASGRDPEGELVFTLSTGEVALLPLTELRQNSEGQRNVKGLMIGCSTSIHPLNGLFFMIIIIFG